DDYFMYPHCHETDTAMDGTSRGDSVAGADRSGRRCCIGPVKGTVADMAGKEGTVITVDYAPGAASDQHFHPGSVFAYVLEGAVVSQLGGEQSVTYSKGQSWYESPRKPHVVSKNASTTEPAKLLVFLLSQESEPLVVPMKSSGSGK